MKLRSLNQEIRCPQCKTVYTVKTSHRIMNFTSGEIIFICSRCQKKLGATHFSEWNPLKRADIENPAQIPTQREKKVSPQRSRSNRGHRR